MATAGGSNRSSRRREALLAEAATVIAERGLANTRIADIGERIGMSASHVLYYFSSKAELMLEARRREWGIWRDATKVAMAGTTSAWHQLMLFADRTLPAQPPDTRWLLIVESARHAHTDPTFAELETTIGTEYIAMIAGIIGRGVADGEFVHADPHSVALQLGGMLDGFALYVLIGVDDRAELLGHARAFAGAALGVTST
jgi:AcrR family transcriptional regulator